MMRSPTAAESPSARAFVVLLANKLPVPPAVVGHSSVGAVPAMASVTKVDLTKSASPLEIQIWTCETKSAAAFCSSTPKIACQVSPAANETASVKGSETQRPKAISVVLTVLVPSAMPIDVKAPSITCPSRLVTVPAVPSHPPCQAQPEGSFPVGVPLVK